MLKALSEGLTQRRVFIGRAIIMPIFLSLGTLSAQPITPCCLDALHSPAQQNEFFKARSSLRRDAVTV